MQVGIKFTIWLLDIPQWERKYPWSTTQPRHYMKIKGQIIRASSSHHAKYRMRGFLWIYDTDVVENTPRTLPKGITSPSVTTGVVQLPVAHAHTQGNPEGVKWPSVAMLLLLGKKRGKKPGMRRTYFRSGPLPVTWLCHFRTKGPNRADIVQLTVAHAQNILPDMWLPSFPVTWLVSLPVTWPPVAPPHSIP